MEKVLIGVLLTWLLIAHITLHQTNYELGYCYGQQKTKEQQKEGV